MADDLFSSAKGPGIIGLVLGLIVLGGFALLGMAVFDGRLTGETADGQNKERHKNKERIARLRNLVLQYEEERADLARYRKVEDELKRIRARRNRVKGEVSETGSEVAKLRTEWEEYKVQYRRAARNRIVGATFEELTTADGRTYTSVKVTGITPLEMKFSHRNGVAKVPLERLPANIRDQLQFEESEKRELTERRGEQNQRDFLLGKIKGLKIKIQQIRDYNERIRGDILKNNQSKALNELKIEEFERKAEAEEEQYLVDKAAGRSSRADDRAQAARNGAAAIRSQNVALDARNARLGADIRKQEGRLAAFQREIERLQGELRRHLPGAPQAPEK